MALIDLNKMSLAELMTLRKDVAQAITNLEKRQREDALAAVEAVAKEHGFNLGALMGASKAERTAPAPKYRHPENAELTWSGRGRKPKWIAAALEAGLSLEDLAIRTD